MYVSTKGTNHKTTQTRLPRHSYPITLRGTPSKICPIIPIAVYHIDVTEQFIRENYVSPIFRHAKPFIHFTRVLNVIYYVRKISLYSLDYCDIYESTYKFAVLRNESD